MPAAEVESPTAIAQRIADEELFPTAQDVDRLPLIPLDRFAVLADAGLLGIAGPAELGFGGLDVHELRQVMAAVSSGCGATFFAWAQHHGVVRTISGASNGELRDEWLPRLCRGEVVAGTAFAHLRRGDRRAVTAARVAGGWRLVGFAPWATSWGIAEIFTVAAESESGEVVWTLIDGVEQPGLDVVPLALPVFGSTGTVALRFDGFIVPDDRVLGIDDATAWRASDRIRAAAGQTGVLGVADRATRLLVDEVRGRDDPAGDAARRLRRQLDDIWQRDRAVVDSLGGATDDEQLAEASDHRAACLDLGQRATTALLAARGGSGMDLNYPAQRLAREAAFYVIQAQTVDGRAATLRSV
ncbi:MAG: alkylation response protein AidB-like acyl-CoA dehydrogenase [Ilumatobacter sp.]|jgi:alkylation response protein AidB-like acyl-CoA dehydrogenase